MFKDVYHRFSFSLVDVLPKTSNHPRCQMASTALKQHRRPLSSLLSNSSFVILGILLQMSRDFEAVADKYEGEPRLSGQTAWQKDLIMTGQGRVTVEMLLNELKCEGETEKLCDAAQTCHLKVCYISFLGTMSLQGKQGDFVDNSIFSFQISQKLLYPSTLIYSFRCFALFNIS